MPGGPTCVRGAGEESSHRASLLAYLLPATYTSMSQGSHQQHPTWRTGSQALEALGGSKELLQSNVMG